MKTVSDRVREILDLFEYPNMDRVSKEKVLERHLTQVGKDALECAQFMATFFGFQCPKQL